MGHTQHYNQVGNGYWTDYITYVVTHGGYGEKSDAGSGRIAVSEGWGYYAERIDLIDKYGSSATPVWRNFALVELENQLPDNTHGYQVNRGYQSRGWFATGLYHDMTDNTVEPTITGVTDNVTAFTTATVYRGLQPTVTSVRDYQARVQAQTGNLQAAQMDQLVSSYQW